MSPLLLLFILVITLIGGVIIGAVGMIYLLCWISSDHPSSAIEQAASLETPRE